jgi:folate-binding protein YgfZ
MTLTQALLAGAAPDLVWFRGPDVVRFLNDLLSQEIAVMAPGEVRRSMLLNPQGRIDHLLWVLRGDDEVGLVTDPDRGADLAATLGRYRIRVAVEIEESTEPAWLVIGAFSESVGVWSRTNSGLTADVSWSDVPRFLVVGEQPELPAIDAGALESLRIGSREPVVGVDIGPSTIPQETGLVPVTVDVDKGCFLGQELVGRIHRRGHVNKQLRVLEFPGEAGQAGSEITRGELTVGTLTSVSGSVGLATLRREVEAGETVKVGTREAVVAR